MKKPQAKALPLRYPSLVTGSDSLLEQSRGAVARAANCFMTATYWEIGRRIIEFEQGGRQRAEYGEELISKLAKDLTDQHGRGFSERNPEQMRLFYKCWPIPQTLSAKSVPPISATPSRTSSTAEWMELLQSLALPKVKRLEADLVATRRRFERAGTRLPSRTGGAK